MIYQYRWTIEIFFRFLKHVLGCRHLLSQHPDGIRIQMYSAVIACMLITLWTGRKPNLRTYEMICHHFSGAGQLRGADGPHREAALAPGAGVHENELIPALRVPRSSGVLVDAAHRGRWAPRRA